MLLALYVNFSAQCSVNCTTDNNYGYNEFTFYTYVHKCNMCVSVHLLVIALVSLYLEAIFIFSHLYPLLIDCL